MNAIVDGPDTECRRSGRDIVRLLQSKDAVIDDMRRMLPAEQSEALSDRLEKACSDCVDAVDAAISEAAKARA